MLEDTDAALVIGDPAMRLAASASQFGVRIYDLAEEWRTMTGLPFVFAVWAVREEVADPALIHDFLAAKQEGLERLEQLATSCSEELRLPQEDLLDYLRNCVNYDLDANNIAGMSRYFELAAEYGLIPTATPLKFLPPGALIRTSAK